MRRLDRHLPSSLRPHGWARDNGEQDTGKKILIRDVVVVVVIGSETSQLGSLLVLKKSVATVECNWDRTGTTGMVLIDKMSKIRLGFLAPYGPYFTHGLLSEIVCDSKRLSPIAYPSGEKTDCVSLNRKWNSGKNGVWYK
jgi:hypothetical protein